VGKEFCAIKASDYVVSAMQEAVLFNTVI